MVHDTIETFMYSQPKCNKWGKPQDNLYPTQQVGGKWERLAWDDSYKTVLI